MVVYTLRKNCFLVSSLIIIVLCVAAFVVNSIYFQFPGNNYFPAMARLPGIYLALIYLGLRIVLEADDYIIQIANYIILLYLAFVVIALLTNAAQLTPFEPIDKYLIAVDEQFPIHLVSMMAWTAKHPVLHDLLETSYASLAWQMTFIPFFLAFFGRFSWLKEYYCLLLISAIIGFSFYYFFPTTAPAANLSSPYFSQEQYDTGLKFNQIHHHIMPTTLEGGLIALPSFHVIWAWFCLYLARCWRPLLIMLIPLNTLLIISCVLLGWHYVIDILGAALVIVCDAWYLLLSGKQEDTLTDILSMGRIINVYPSHAHQQADGTGRGSVLTSHGNSITKVSSIACPS